MRCGLAGTCSRRRGYRCSWIEWNGGRRALREVTDQERAGGHFIGIGRAPAERFKHAVQNLPALLFVGVEMRSHRSLKSVAQSAHRIGTRLHDKSRKPGSPQYSYRPPEPIRITEPPDDSPYTSEF